MNLFGRRTHAVGDEGLRVARGLADFASLGIRLTDQVGHHDELVRQLRDALESRIVIEQAKGVIATQAGIDVAEAFERLRNEARNSGRLLADVAAAWSTAASAGQTGRATPDRGASRPLSRRPDPRPWLGG